jgi:hypothetical protein
VKNIGKSISDTTTIQVTIVGVGDDDDFSDNDANIAWVSLLIMGIIAASALAAYVLHKYNFCCYDCYDHPPYVSAELTV